LEYGGILLLVPPSFYAMQYKLDLEGRFVLFYRRSFTAEQIAEIGL
jgi:hypothetical protein